jgi:histidine phosphotransfer protein HptB
MAQMAEIGPDRVLVAQMRAAMGVTFARVLGYFRDDGVKAIADLETGLRGANAAIMVGAAELLKDSALQIGAENLAASAEAIEFDARDCIEWHQSPESLLEAVIALRGEFAALIDHIDRETSPLATRAETPTRFAQAFRV